MGIVSIFLILWYDVIQGESLDHSAKVGHSAKFPLTFPGNFLRKEIAVAEEKKYWDPEIETMPIDKLRKLQGERLQELVSYAYEKSKFYKQKYD